MEQVEKIKSALIAARNSLATYGKHPIIEKQIDNAIKELNNLTP